MNKLEESLAQYKDECAQLHNDQHTLTHDLKTADKRLQQALQKMQKVGKCV